MRNPLLITAALAASSARNRASNGKTSGGSPPRWPSTAISASPLFAALALGTAAWHRRAGGAAAPPRAPSTPAKRPGSSGINDTFPADLLDAFKTPALPKKLKRLVTPPADDVAGAPG